VKKLNALLLALALAAAACGGSTPDEPAEEGIAALEEDGGEDAPEGEKDKGSKPGDGPAKKKDGGGKPKANGGGGGTSQPPASGGGSSGSSNNGGNGGSGGGTQTAAAPAPVPQGEHRYATQGQRTISGNTSELPETTTLTAGAPADGVQRQARDLRDSEGNGTLTETDLHYRPNGVFLSYVKVTSRFQGGITDVREFRLPQPQLIAPAGGGPGFSRAFTMQGSGTTAKVTVEAHRWEDVTVGGGKARALVVETDIRFSGALEGYQRSVSWFWPKHLIPLKEQVETDVRNGPIRLQSNYQAQIQRLP
jgi:hypothetical protein